MAEYNVNKKKLECLMAWAQYYSNAKSLAVPVIPNMKAYMEVQKEIEALKKEMFSINKSS